MTALEYAKTFIGEKEKPNNGGFYNPKLQEIMTRAGHKYGEAWCAYFMEACFCEPIKGTTKEAELRILFSASAVSTYGAFKKNGYKISMIPTVGALVIYRKFKDGQGGWQGHAGIVSEVINEVQFRDIGGNTSAAGSREGTIVGENPRSTKFRSTGLNVMGFITIEQEPLPV